MTDNTRDAFENWAIKDAYENTAYFCAEEEPYLLRKYDTGAYKDKAVELEFKGFQAARALDAERIEDLEKENERLREALIALDQSINKYGECEAWDDVYKCV